MVASAAPRDKKTRFHAVESTVTPKDRAGGLALRPAPGDPPARDARLPSAHEPKLRAWREGRGLANRFWAGHHDDPARIGRPRGATAAGIWATWPGYGRATRGSSPCSRPRPDASPSSWSAPCSWGTWNRSFRYPPPAPARGSWTTSSRAPRRCRRCLSVRCAEPVSAADPEGWLRRAWRDASAGQSHSWPCSSVWPPSPAKSNSR